MLKRNGRVQCVDEFAGLGNKFHSPLRKLMAVFRGLRARQHLRNLTELELEAVDPIHIHGRTMQDDVGSALFCFAQF
jgi:hypothetical protein